MASAGLRLAACMALVGGVCACAQLRAVQRQQSEYRTDVTLRGSVRTLEPGSNPLVVVLIRFEGDDTDIVDHYTVHGGGSWLFRALPGRYALAAFEDRSGDLVYQPDELALPARGGPVHDLGPGESSEPIELVIRPEGRAPVAGPMDIMAEVADVRARTPADQALATVGLLAVNGEVTGLDDPRFDRRFSELGADRPFDFALQVHPGLYFLEEYDPEATPVLFVHGMRGNPREFGPIIDSLDRDRYQPWVFYYPSGIRLSGISRVLAQQVLSQRMRLGFERLYVVAHSMGGLVARDFLLRSADADGAREVRLFVSISSPWGGLESAARGTRMVSEERLTWPAWRDLASDSEFLTGLFFEDPERREPRRLPSHLDYHLIYGHPDSVVPLESALALTRWEQASVRGFPFGHTEILDRPETHRFLEELFERAESPPGALRPGQAAPPCGRS